MSAQPVFTQEQEGRIEHIFVENMEKIFLPAVSLMIDTAFEKYITPLRQDIGVMKKDLVIIHEKLHVFDEKIDALTVRVDHMEIKLNRLITRVDHIEIRLERIETQVGRIEHHLGFSHTKPQNISVVGVSDKGKHPK